MTELVAWHSSGESPLVVRRGLHVGTIEQARMRGGRHLHRVVLEIDGRVPRLRDRGSWSAGRLLASARTARLAVYLNRHEGIPLDEFERVRSRMDLDAAPDSEFRRMIPSCADSWIVLDPSVVRAVEEVDRGS